MDKRLEDSTKALRLACRPPVESDPARFFVFSIGGLSSWGLDVLILICSAETSRDRGTSADVDIGWDGRRCSKKIEQL